MSSLQPADLQLYLFSAEKRQRVSKTQSPTTPAKGESRVAALAVAGRTEPLEDTSEASLQSPVLELSDGEADEETSAELSQEVRIKVKFFFVGTCSCLSSHSIILLTVCFQQVLRQELKHVQHELATAKQVTAEMQAEKERTDKEVSVILNSLAVHSLPPLCCCISGTLSFVTWLGLLLSGAAAANAAASAGKCKH